MIVEAIIESKRKKISSYPVHTNRASDLGNPCVRYHVYNRTRWAEKTLHDVGLQQIFDLGNDIEKIVLRELAEAGIEVLEQQRSFEWKEYQITGHVDGFIHIVGEKGYYPLEIKSMSPYVFDSITDIDSLKNGKYSYLRKYPTQLTLYMLMKGIDRGVFLFKNKSTGAYKEIWMQLDYDLGEETLQRAEAINKYVENGTLPERIEDDRECDNCPFTHICLPEHIGTEFQIMEKPELIEWLNRAEELKPLVSEYNEIDGQIKKALEGVEKAIIGDYVITGKWIDRKPYEVKGGKYWSRKIQRAA